MLDADFEGKQKGYASMAKRTFIVFQHPNDRFRPLRVSNARFGAIYGTVKYCTQENAKAALFGDFHISTREDIHFRFH